MNTHTIVVDIHQKVSKTREEADSQNRAVSDAYTLHHYRINADHRTDSKQVSNLDH